MLSLLLMVVSFIIGYKIGEFFTIYVELFILFLTIFSYKQINEKIELEAFFCTMIFSFLLFVSIGIVFENLFSIGGESIKQFFQNIHIVE